MSSRTYMLAIESLEPIKAVVGFGNQDLLDRLLANLDSHNPNLPKVAEAMLMDTAISKEPGSWNYLIQPLAKLLGLKVDQLPLDDWKHYAVWSDYRARVAPMITREAQEFLRLLEVGRPLRGVALSHDGCMYAWLSNEEVIRLLQALLPIDPDDILDLEDFHDELIESLERVIERKMDLFLGAH